MYDSHARLVIYKYNWFGTKLALKSSDKLVVLVGFLFVCLFVLLHCCVTALVELSNLDCVKQIYVVKVTIIISSTLLFLKGDRLKMHNLNIWIRIKLNNLIFFYMFIQTCKKKRICEVNANCSFSVCMSEVNGIQKPYLYFIFIITFKICNVNH